MLHSERTGTTTIICLWTIGIPEGVVGVTVRAHVQYM
jgi:hypothetical protein